MIIITIIIMIIIIIIIIIVTKEKAAGMKWSALQMLLTYCENDLILACSADYSISSNVVANQATTFKITDTKRYVPVVILSNQDNSKLLQQFVLGFKRTINWNEHQLIYLFRLPD